MGPEGYRRDAEDLFETAFSQAPIGMALSPPTAVG